LGGVAKSCGKARDSALTFVMVGLDEEADISEAEVGATFAATLVDDADAPLDATIATVGVDCVDVLCFC